MPTNSIFPTVKDSETIKMAPYVDWDIPQVKDETGDHVPKYDDAIRNIGYVVKVPTNVRIEQLQRIYRRGRTQPGQVSKELADFMCNKVIVDWYDVNEDATEESEEWEDAKEHHRNALARDIQLASQLATEYLQRFAVTEKNDEGDGDDL